jgi:hypothetical protein
MFADTNFRAGIRSTGGRNSRGACSFITSLGNDITPFQLSPGYPQDFVDKLWMVLPVGTQQREEIEQWRGFPPGAFGYNESPTSSCHTFCWKARQKFDVPFF